MQVHITIDLPDDLHELTAAIARGAGMSVSETVTRLLQAALSRPGRLTVSTDPLTGLAFFSRGDVVTSEDVSSTTKSELRALTPPA